MSLHFVIDMNLSAEWVAEFERHGWSGVHWSTVGPANAPDEEIMSWAREHGHIVFTHDLDFGTMLALTHAAGPSVLQVRTQCTMPEDIGHAVVGAVTQHAAALRVGALVVVELAQSRVRVLPL